MTKIIKTTNKKCYKSYYSTKTPPSIYYNDIFDQHPLILFLLKIIKLLNYPLKVFSSYDVIKIMMQI